MQEALLGVDRQNDCCSGGALAVPGADAVVPLANRLREQATIRVLTADWHPPAHASFAASHAGKQPFERGLVAASRRRSGPCMACRAATEQPSNRI